MLFYHLSYSELLLLIVNRAMLSNICSKLLELQEQ